MHKALLQFGHLLMFIVGAGGAAEVIAYSWNLLHNTNSSVRSYSSSELRILVRRMLHMPHATEEILDSWVGQSIFVLLLLLLYRLAILIFFVG